jgi:AcrR family transcriptional regulator
LTFVNHKNNCSNPEKEERSMSKTKEDARIVKTREKLLSAIRELLRKKPFQEITVNEICDTADVRRATFYKHYRDKYDFLGAMAGEMRKVFEKNIWDTIEHKYSRDYYTAYVEALINFVDNQEAMVRFVIGEEIAATVIYTLISDNYEKTRQRLRADVDRGLRIAASVDMVAGVLASGIGGVIVDWLKNGKTTPKETLISECRSICNALILG